MTRLPTVGDDNNSWGTVLNAFLGVAHNADGSLTAFVNILDFGADRTGTNDSTTAIQNAINATASSIVIWCPYGNYLLSSPLIVDRDQVTIVGEGGEFTTQFTMSASADPTYALIVGHTQNVLNCLVKGITFKGRNDTTSTGGSILLQGSQCSLKQVRVIQFGGNGIVVQGYSGASINDIYMEDVYLTENGKNTTIPGDNLVINSTVYDCEYHRVIAAGNSDKTAGRHGFNNAGYCQKFVDCHAYFMQNYGFYQNGGSGTVIIGGEYETNAQDQINIQYTDNTIIMGARMFGGSSYKDISLTSVSQSVVNGNACNSSTTDKNIGLYNCDECVVVGNSCANAGGAGIDIGASTKRVIVANNHVASAKIAVTGTYCIVKNNMLSSSGIQEYTGADYNRIDGNTLYTGGQTITVVGTHTKVFRNLGFVTEAHGSASITSGNTSIAVTHGLALTPALEQISVTPQTTLGSAAKFWISNPTSTQFTINVDVNPTQTVTFGWNANVGY